MTEAPASWPAGVRPAGPNDAGGILAAATAALERGEYPGLDRHDLEVAADRIASEPGIAAVAEVDGRLAGWIVPLFFDLTVDLPFRRRGHGTRLLVAGRSLAGTAGLDDLRLWVPAGSGEAFASRAGMRYHSSLYSMRLPAGRPVEAPRFTPGLETRPIAPGADDAAFTELALDTFRGHPTPLRLSLERVRQVHARPGFDPATILLVSPVGDPSRLVGFCRVTGHADDAGRPVWEVAHVGVRPQWRGRGLGRALVAWGVAEARRHGAGDVRLSVESGNERALGLYEALGFERDGEWRRWSLAPDAPDPGA